MLSRIHHLFNFELLRRKDDEALRRKGGDDSALCKYMLRCNYIGGVTREFDTKKYELFDVIRSKEQSDSLIVQIKVKSLENSYLNAQLQEKVFAIAALKNELRKLKGKDVVDSAVSKPTATTIAPGIFKINLEPLPPKLLNNREAHMDYLNHILEHTAFLKEIVKQGRSLNPLDSALDYTCNASGSKPLGNTKNNRISQSSSSNKTNKVEYQSKSIKSRMNKKNHVNNANYVSEPISNAPVSNCSKFLGTVRFGNDHIYKIMGYGNYQMGNVIISWVYYVEGLGHNLFSVGQFCDSDLEVAFRKHTCVICDLEDLGKLKLKADIGIFGYYAPAKKAFKIYNKRTRMTIETIHVDFDELTTIDSEQFSLGPGPKLLTPGIISSGLVPNIPSSTSYVPRTKND
ncbi:hypothetical protein Tco_0964746 [Tanacetum coccineum]